MKYLNYTGVEHLIEKIQALFVAKEAGKGLSTNDYTTAEKNKLASIENGATANKEYYGICSTEAGTQIKVVNCTGFKLEEGCHIRIIFTNAQTYNGVVQLNVNSTGAINVQYIQGTNSIRYIWSAGELIDFTYNGTYWIMHERALASTTYYGVVRLSPSAISASTALALTPSALNSTMQNIVTGYPVYSPSSTYAIGDRVRFGVYVYECITAITTAEAWTAAHWKIVDSLQKQIDDLESSIPSEVTEATVSGWGFTKNTGTYSKPSGGIPKTDLASAVQTSLGKADSALQEHQDISGKENTSNKVTSMSSSSTDTQYPSAKSIYDELYYKTGDTFTTGPRVTFPAMITGDAKDISITVFTPKRLDNINQITINKLNLSIRKPAGGYILGLNSDFKTYAGIGGIKSNSFEILVYNESGWGVTNNTPLAVSAENLSVTFN